MLARMRAAILAVITKSKGQFARAGGGRYTDEVPGDLAARALDAAVSLG